MDQADRENACEALQELRDAHSGILSLAEQLAALPSRGDDDDGSLDDLWLDVDGVRDKLDHEIARLQTLLGGDASIPNEGARHLDFSGSMKLVRSAHRKLSALASAEDAKVERLWRFDGTHSQGAAIKQAADQLYFCSCELEDMLSEFADGEIEAVIAKIVAR